LQFASHEMAVIFVMYLRTKFVLTSDRRSHSYK